MAFNFPVETIQEGDAGIIVPRLEAFRRTDEVYAPSRAPVFYNPLMKLNRDVAVLVLQVHQKRTLRELHVSEPLAGCGVRGIRFAKEVDGISRVYLNDINPEAFKMAQHNIRLNGLTSRVLAANEDANLFLSRYAAPRKRFDCVDVDPFGAPVLYLDSAVRGTRDGGLLALTATDLAPLCGVYPKSALRKYGGLSLRTEYCNEIAVRLLASCLAMTAARHDVGTTVLFSHSTDHYVRLYASANYGAKKADESIRKIGYIQHCFTCFHREIYIGMLPPVKQQCNECGSHLKTAGPLWLGKIADREFCELMENEAISRRNEEKIVKMLSLIKMEADAPDTYYVIDKICDKLGVPVPPLRKVIEKLRERGYLVVQTHFHTRGIKTSAPAKTVTGTIEEIAEQS